VTTTTLLGESRSNVAQMVTPTTTGCLEKASAAKDSGVEAWLKSHNMHSIPVRDGISTTCKANRAILSRKPFHVSLAQHNEPEGDIIINHVGQKNLSKTQSENQPITPVAGDADVLSMCTAEDVPSPNISDREDTHDRGPY
jgi:hypothetical protein